MLKEKIFLSEEKNIYDLYDELGKRNLRTQEFIYLGLGRQFFRTHNARSLQKAYNQTYLRNQGNPFSTKLPEGLLKPISFQEMKTNYLKNVGLFIKVLEMERKLLSEVNASLPAFLQVPVQDKTFSQNPWIFSNFPFDLTNLDREELSKRGYHDPDLQVLAKYVICLRLRFWHNYANTKTFGYRSIVHLKNIEIILNNQSPWINSNDLISVAQREEKALLSLKINKKRFWIYQFQISICHFVLNVTFLLSPIFNLFPI